MSIGLISESMCDFFSDFDLDDEEVEELIQAFTSQLKLLTANVSIDLDSTTPGESIDFSNEEFKLLLDQIAIVAPDLAHVTAATMYLNSVQGEEPFLFEFSHATVSLGEVSLKVSDLASLDTAVVRIVEGLGRDSEEHESVLASAVEKLQYAIRITKDNGHILGLDC